MLYATGEWVLDQDSKVSLTVHSSVWSYLALEADPMQDYVVVSRTSTCQWIVGLLPRHYPGMDSAPKARLEGYTLVYDNDQHLGELDGKELCFNDGLMTIV